MKGKLVFSSQNPIKSVNEKEKKIFSFLNLYSLELFCREPKFAEAVSFSESVNFPDGKIVSRYLRIKQQRGPGFMRDFIIMDENKNKKHFFIGPDKDEIPLLSHVTSIPENKINSYNPLFISGIEFPESEKEKMIKEINQFRPDFLWVCVGNPKQEILSYQIFDKVNAEKIFNVGAALDFLLEKKKEAPKLWRTLGLEWLYLGFTNPKRTLKKIKGSFMALAKLNLLEKR